MKWNLDDLNRTAVGVSASRRTDIPALFGQWFERRLDAGFVEYIPAGPPRRVRRSIAPADVSHFTFWSRWPRPFFRTLDTVLRIGYPVLWNVTITGLGGHGSRAKRSLNGKGHRLRRRSLPHRQRRSHSVAV